MTDVPSGSITNRFSPRASRYFAVQPALVPPSADSGTRFDVKFLEDVLDVLCYRARAATKNLADLAVALCSGNPLGNLELPVC
jgi:hypothetical protein